MLVAFDKFSEGQDTSRWLLREWLREFALVSRERDRPVAIVEGFPLGSRGSREYCQSWVCGCGQGS